MNSVFVEGFAVAYDLDDGTLTPIQEAKAMRDLRIAPNLERLLAPGGFQREASSRAYTYSGAFMRYLDGRFGTPAMRRMYATKDLAVLGPPKTLIADFERMLDTVTTDAVARSSSANRNAEPSIFQRRCARQVSEIVDSAFALSRNRRWNEAIVKFDEACALQPDDPTFVDYKLNTAIAMKPSSLSRILAIADTLWRHPKLDPLRESSSRTRVGDELWRRGDTARARAQYARAAALPTGRSGSTVTMRLRATQDPALAQLIMPYYTEPGTQPATVLRMSDAIAAGRQDALLAYLVGNYYLFRSTLDKAGDLLDRAATIGLNDPVLTRIALSGVMSARAQRHRCDDAERARIRLRAAAGSATELAIAGDWVDRCRFAVARGWSPVQ